MEHLPVLHLWVLAAGVVAPSLYDTTEHILYHSHQRQSCQLCRTCFPAGSLVAWALEHPLRVCLARLGSKEGSFLLKTDQDCAG